jgi:methylglyoxal reductase
MTPPTTQPPSLTPKDAVCLPHRQLGESDLYVSPVAMGCWPIAGISSLGTSDAQSLATIEAAVESGINHFDTAYSYGFDGESDRLLRSALGRVRERVVIASKVGTHYDANRQRVLDASPARIRQQADAIRQRLGLDVIDLLYLHTPDGVTDIEQSAATLAELVEKKVVRFVGASNVSPEELERFSRVITPVVVQPPFNMLQPETLEKLRPFLATSKCGVACYWPLMKGLLAGGMQRDHTFDPLDKRLTYPIFQGKAWERAQDLLDVLRQLAHDHACSVTQLVVHWTLRQPQITTVLCGAKRPEQIRESAAAMRMWLDDAVLAVIANELRRTLRDDPGDPVGSG